MQRIRGDLLVNACRTRDAKETTRWYKKGVKASHEVEEGRPNEGAFPLAAAASVGSLECMGICMRTWCSSPSVKETHK